MSGQQKAIDLLNKFAGEMGLFPRNRRNSLIYWRIPKGWTKTKYRFGYTPWKTLDPETKQEGYFALKYRLRKDGTARLVKKVRFGRRKVATQRSRAWHCKYYGLPA